MIARKTSLFLAIAAAALTAAGSPVNAAPACSPPGEVNECPQVLHMRPGSYGILVDGMITQSHYQRVYALAVRAKQTIAVSFAGARDMRGSISCGDGGDGPWYGLGNSYTVKTGGTCLIRVGANPQSGEPWDGGFTLAIIVK